MTKAKVLKLKKGEALMLRTCAADGTSYNGFRWPKSGPVKCSDWSNEAECGHGLHGLLWGQGDGSLLDWSPDAVWLVVRVKTADVVDIIARKIKVPAGIVEYYGKAEEAVALIQKHAPAGTVIVRGTATAGYRGTATAGYRGTATAGYRGTATAGYRGTATAGYGGTATAGDRGTATAGYGGSISILYWNGEKYKRAIFAVGEDGIEPNTKYRVDSTGKPEKG